jgi:hypothetical protein
MPKTRYVLKRKGGSRKKKHVRFNLSTRSRRMSRGSRRLRRSSTLGIALKLKRGRSSATRARGKSVARGKYRAKTRSRSRLGGFRGGYGPGGGPVGAPWDGGENVPGGSVQGLPNATHYAYNKGGIGVGGLDPAVSTRMMDGNQTGGGFVDMVTKMMPQDLRTFGELVGFNTSTSAAIRAGEASMPENPLPTNQKIDSESRIVYPETPTNLGGFSSDAANQSSKV